MPLDLFTHTIECGSNHHNLSANRRTFVVSALAAIGILLAGAARKPGCGNRGPAQVTGPADAAGLIDQLRTDGIVLTYDLQDRTLHAGDDDVPSVTIGKNR